MKTKNKRDNLTWMLCLALCIGILVGVLITLFTSAIEMDGGYKENNLDKKQPLYWVAPMDPNYQRAKPGLSPMGMALIPVYKQKALSNDAGPGTIKISPDVINNLGVRTQQAIYQPLQQSIRAFGTVKYNEDAFIHIHPRVEGWIETLFITSAGDPVKKGEPLYELYSPELVNAQQEFLSEQNASKGNLSQASKIRLKSLNISDQFIENLKRTKKIQQAITFYASQNGVVDHLNIRTGYFVKPDTTLMSIGNLDKIWVEAEVFEKQVQYIKPNQQVVFTLNHFPQKKWVGKIDYIYPALSKDNKSLRIRIEIENAEHQLKPNMFGTVNINIGNDKKRLLVPSHSVIRTEENNRVVVALGDGEFKSVEVKTGIVTNEFTEIIKGISKEESVVEQGLFLLDSESSKQSDFKRMHHPLNQPSATVNGVIKDINLKNNRILVNREAIPKWNRNRADVSFTLDSSININTLKTGNDIRFTFIIDHQNFVITKIHSNNKIHTSSAQEDM